ncbi:MAG: hypothetical protein QNK37_33775 [Acidobacteriota bacterium]|nr:hypothetical protein [Acidobacteriota bacterium]
MGEMMLPLFLLLLFSNEAIRKVARGQSGETLLHECEHSWRMQLREKGEWSELGKKTVRIEAVNDAGRDCWLITIIRDIISRETELTDTLLLDRETLVPVRYNNAVPQLQSISLECAPGQIRGSFERKGDQRRALEESMGDPSYDFAFFAPLLAALPLQAGFEAGFPIFHFLEGETLLTVQVIGETRYDIGEKSLPAWEVAVGTGSGTKVTYLVDPDRRIPLRETVGDFKAELI